MILVEAFTSTSGTVAVMDSDAVTSAVLMPLTVSALVSGSYSMTAPSGKTTCHASAEADGAGLSSEKIPGSTKAVSSSPPIASSRTCSPTEGAHHVRERPARVVSQFSHVVWIPPLCTRHSPCTVSTSVTTPERMRLRIARASSCIVDNVFIVQECLWSGIAPIRAAPVVVHTIFICRCA